MFDREHIASLMEKTKVTVLCQRNGAVISAKFENRDNGKSKAVRFHKDFVTNIDTAIKTMEELSEP